MKTIIFTIMVLLCATLGFTAAFCPTDYPNLYWVTRGGVIPFTFESDVSESSRNIVRDVAKTITSYNIGINMRDIQDGDVDPLVFKNDTNDYAYDSTHIGLKFWDKRTVTHVIGHLLAFRHEHQREDRDNYITVITNDYNVKPKQFFSILTSDYDFLSIMHYPEQNYLKVLPQYTQFSNYIYISQEFSPRDVDGLSKTFINTPTLVKVTVNYDTTISNIFFCFDSNAWYPYNVLNESNIGRPMKVQASILDLRYRFKQWTLTSGNATIEDPTCSMTTMIFNSDCTLTADIEFLEDQPIPENCTIGSSFTLNSVVAYNQSGNPTFKKGSKAIVKIGKKTITLGSTKENTYDMNCKLKTKVAQGTYEILIVDKKIITNTIYRLVILPPEIIKIEASALSIVVYGKWFGVAPVVSINMKKVKAKTTFDPSTGESSTIISTTMSSGTVNVKNQIGNVSKIF